ncbi:hypothetical protein COLO4_05630 [Corchorus olitorius]|uniref:Uncharacterized protein n=1 Tax=Corchorus olitorius TaxID=93759 RepID=A0A1R3KQC8_9ROSI|nr:hypothetical protein COLO4_05630 [Corchorus olitorius]
MDDWETISHNPRDAIDCVLLTSCQKDVGPNNSPQ